MKKSSTIFLTHSSPDPDFDPAMASTVLESSPPLATRPKMVPVDQKQLVEFWPGALAGEITFQDKDHNWWWIGEMSLYMEELNGVYPILGTLLVSMSSLPNGGLGYKEVDNYVRAGNATILPTTEDVRSFLCKTAVAVDASTITDHRPRPADSRLVP